ncbi:PAS domain-containing protein [Shewanella corallii]|uniref:PAS domain-containing protein n=1 Tax=Shewanella corallii TaxID=560080 RepID=A0ABT0N579_9GAMM|nr:PAS domain-containing protein [Shewanella corallii]MCL2913564.1 PAS domain-containing protein [Shewanella corallii]
MLKRNLAPASNQSMLLPSQGPRWSRQRLLGISAQLAMLLLLAVLFTNVMITLGEQRLRQDWATQRYSELQTVGTLLADKVNFQQFRTRIFARGELLRQYLETPSDTRKALILDHWHTLVHNMPDLLGVALYNPSGRLEFASSDIFGDARLPASLLGGNRTMGGKDIYNSPVELVANQGQLEPFMYQLAWLENPDQSVRGYLVTYNSLSRTLTSVRPAFAGKHSPLMLFDNQGLMYIGPGTHNDDKLPAIQGESLAETYPELWQQMSGKYYGQLHEQETTYVYIKVELATQYETKRELYLVSYIKDGEVAAKFTHWRHILLTFAVVITLVSAGVIVLFHLYKLEQRSRLLNIELSRGLFNTDAGWMIVGDSGRIIKANRAAAQALKQETDALEDRSLQWALQLDDTTYREVTALLNATAYWQGEVDLSGHGGSTVRTRIRKLMLLDQRKEYLLVNIDNITELTQTRHEAFLYRMMTEVDTALALTDAQGKILKMSPECLSLLQLESGQQCNLADCLDDQGQGQWQRISEQLNAQGFWRGQISCNHRGSGDAGLQASLKAIVNHEGEVEYVACSFNECSQKGLATDSTLPHRSTVLVNHSNLIRYYESLAVEARDNASVMLLDVTPSRMLSHMSDIGQLEQRANQIEIQLLRELPRNYQMSHWQLGKLIVVMPNTHPNKAHEFAEHVLHKLADLGLAEGLSIGIAANQPEQSLQNLLDNAEVALRRAKQPGEQNICQAFTRSL